MGGGAECMENNLEIKECVAVPMLIFPKGVADKIERLTYLESLC